MSPGIPFIHGGGLAGWLAGSDGDACLPACPFSSSRRSVSSMMPLAGGGTVSCPTPTGGGCFFFFPVGRLRAPPPSLSSEVGGHEPGAGL